jgi:hypothetical protein
MFYIRGRGLYWKIPPRGRGDIINKSFGGKNMKKQREKGGKCKRKRKKGKENGKREKKEEMGKKKEERGKKMRKRGS